MSGRLRTCVATTTSATRARAAAARYPTPGSDGHSGLHSSTTSSARRRVGGGDWGLGVILAGVSDRPSPLQHRPTRRGD